MKALWLDYKEIIGVLRSNSNRFLKYQIGTKLLLAIILLPLFKGIFNMALKSRGMSYLANGLVQKFIMSPQGVGMILFALFFGIMVVMIEMGGLIVLSHQVLLSEKESSFFHVMMHSLKSMKQFIGVDGLLIMFYLLLIAPMMDSNIKTSILANLKIPGYVMDTIVSNNVFVITLAIGFMIFFVLASNWMFSLHIVLLSPKKEKHFLRESRKLVNKHWRFILKHSLIVAALNLLILVGLVIVYVLISAVVLLLFSGVALEPVALILLSIAIIGFFGVSFFFTPFQLIHMTIIYHQIIEDKPSPLDLTGNKKENFLDRLITSKKVLINVFIAATVGVSIFTIVLIDEIENTKYAVEITAHRGSSKDAPENTLISLDTAIENGASYAEIDVQETKDGGIVLLHDKSLERTTGVKEAVWNLTTKEIQALDAGSWFDESFAGEKIPTLEETMLYSKGRIKLNIEIKTQETDQQLISEVVRLIQEQGYYRECVVTSLDYEALQAVERLDPKIKTGYVMFVALGDLEKLNVDFYSVEESNVNEKFVTTAHTLGREVHVWTINSKESMEKVLELGVDNIITDNDKMLSDLVKSKNTSIW